MTEQVPAPVAVLGQVLSVVRSGSSGINHFGTGREVSGVTRDMPAAGEWVARRR
jgi:hypothetical protein